MSAAAKKYTEHDMIVAHTMLPEFPELRTSVLRAFLEHGANAAEPPRQTALHEAISLAVSLVQLGLDTHELVDGREEPRRRQMTVLAGDYFSSRFYQLLSHAGNVQSIGLLSQSICEVNRIKMHVYSRAKRLLMTAEEYIRSTVDINTHLFLSFTSWLDAVYRKTCPAVLRSIAECELVARELARTHPDTVKDGWAYWYILQNGTADEKQFMVQPKLDGNKLQAVLLKYNVFGKLTDRWETNVAELGKVLRSIPSDKLAKELFRISEPLVAFRHVPRVLEEI